MGKTLEAFDEYYSETLFLKGQLELILAPIHESHQAYYNLLLDANREMFNRGKQQGERLVQDALRKVAFKARKPIQFQHKDTPYYHFGTLPFTETHLEQYTFTASEHTMNRVDSEINKILVDGYREGWGVRDVRNRIMERYDQFSGWEANRIARTELQTAHNMGVMNSYQELGVDYVEWRSAHDKRVRGNRKTDRANHIIMDGEIVKIGEKFSNGLLYPGDKEGKIAEWINCRCSVVPYLMRPGTVAPVGQSNFRDSDVISVSEPNYNQLLSEHTGGALNWEQYQQILQGKSIADLGIVARQVQNKEEDKDMVKAEGLDDLNTFKETIKTENKKLNNMCKRNDCYEEVYSILSEMDLTEFKLSDVTLENPFKAYKKEELKEFIGMTNLDLYNEYYDKPFKKFCEEFGLENDNDILEAISDGINEGGVEVAYPLFEKKLLIRIE